MQTLLQVFIDMEKKTRIIAITLMRLEFLLKGNDFISVNRLGELLILSPRQVYRLINRLKAENKFKIENKGDTYRIFENNDEGKIRTSEELLALYDAIKANSLTTEQSRKLSKLITQSTSMWMNKNPMEEKRNLKIISTIQKAIDNKTQFLIKAYKSRDKDISDRMVTPVLLDKDNRRIYGLEKGQQKCFNFENILGETLLTKFKAEDSGDWNPLEGRDPFGFIKPSDNCPLIDVNVALNPFAHSQLIRQFSYMRKYISDYSKIDKNYPFLLTISVWDIQPIARFCVGLLHSVKILGSVDAIRQIKDYADERIIKIGYNNNFSTI